MTDEMTAAERLELIRTKCGSAINPPERPKGLYCATTGEPPATKGRPRKYVRQAKGIGSTFGFFQHTDERHKQWVRKPDDGPQKELGHAERIGPHYLTKIADKWPIRPLKETAPNP